MVSNEEIDSMCVTTVRSGTSVIESPNTSCSSEFATEMGGVRDYSTGLVGLRDSETM